MANPFVIPAPLTLKTVKQTVSSLHKTISHPENLQIYQDQSIFVQPVNVEIGHENVTGYAYYIPKREQQERENFYHKIHKIIAKLKKVQLRPWMKPDETFKSIAKKYAPYLSWKVNDKRFEISMKPKAISQRVNRIGKFILLYNGNMQWDECLLIYREKDLIEKCFAVLNSDLDAMPLNMRKNETVKGLIFVLFVALIIRMRLRKKMLETMLCEKYTLNQMLIELEKTHLVDLENGSSILTEITKKQRNILDALNIDPHLAECEIKSENKKIVA